MVTWENDEKQGQIALGCKALCVYAVISLEVEGKDKEEDDDCDEDTPLLFPRGYTRVQYLL